jgi:hypothetical protein
MNKAREWLVWTDSGLRRDAASLAALLDSVLESRPHLYHSCDLYPEDQCQACEVERFAAEAHGEEAWESLKQRVESTRADTLAKVRRVVEEEAAEHDDRVCTCTASKACREILKRLEGLK